MESYKDIVCFLYKTGSDKIIPNGKSEHAADLYECFFENAKEEILIFCKNLSKDVFGRPDMLEKIKAAVNRKVNIKIITQEEKPDDTDFAKYVKDNNIYLKSCFKIEALQKAPANFCVVDKKAYRFERSNHEPKATACMNDPRVSETLIEVFNSAEKAISISPAA